MTYFIGLLGPVLFVVTVCLLSAVTPRYSPLQNTISELALHKYRVLHAVNYAVSGTLIALAGLFCVAKGGPVYTALSVSLVGAVLILSAFFKTDPLGGRRITREGMIHNLLFLTGMIAVAIGQFVAVDDTPFGLVTLACGLVTVVGLMYVLFGRWYRGLLQRIMVFTLMAWIAVFTSMVLR